MCFCLFLDVPRAVMLNIEALDINILKPTGHVMHQQV